MLDQRIQVLNGWVGRTGAQSCTLGAGTVDCTLGESTGDGSTGSHLESADTGCLVSGTSGVKGITESRGCGTLCWSRCAILVMAFLVASPYARKGNVLGGSCSKARTSPSDWRRYSSAVVSGNLKVAGINCKVLV